jgi:peptide deformylase
VSDDQSAPYCLINPEILSREGEEEMDEGCLSIPGFYERCGVPSASACAR